MGDDQIGVGILGANPDRGWAARAHVPAIRAVPGLVLTAVGTTRAESADAARTRFGARHAFTDPLALARHPDVDLVVITVKVPAHLELVTAALAAGKHVHCEWPLTRTAAEAASLTAAADAARVRATVGLQARFAPAVARARAIIAEGGLGTILSARLHSSRTKGGVLDVPAWTAYTYDRSSGAGLVEVLGGHALDLMQQLLGPVRDLGGRTAIRRPEHRIAETGEPITVTAADHLVAWAEFAGGVVATVHLHDGATALPRTRFEITGTAGSLALTSAPVADPWAAQLQITPLELAACEPGGTRWQPVPLKPDEASGLPVEAANVARLYRALAADLRHGGDRAPDFRAASALHTLIERIGAPAPHPAVS